MLPRLRFCMLAREDEDSNPIRGEAGRVYRYRLDHIRHGAVQNLDPHLGRHPSKKGPLAPRSSVIEPTDWRSVRSTARSR